VVTLVTALGCGGSQTSNSAFSSPITADPTPTDFDQVETLGVGQLPEGAHIEMGIVYVDGPVHPRSLTASVRDRENRLATCFSALVDRVPEADVDVVVFGLVEIDRRLTQVGLITAGTADQQLLSCLRRTFDGMPVTGANDRVISGVRIPLRFYTDTPHQY
jgi:hypothetical protein